MTASSRRRSDPRVGVQKALIFVAIFVQVASLFVLVFGDADGMAPGDYGLDYTHGLLCLFSYTVALLAGSVLLILSRKWRVLGMQFLVLLLFIVAAAIPPPTPTPVNAANFQHLVGQDKAAMEEELGDYIVSGWSRTAPEGRKHWYSYHGLKVYISEETGAIERVVPR